MEEFVGCSKVNDTYGEVEGNTFVAIGKDYDGGDITPKSSLEEEALIGYRVRELERLKAQEVLEMVVGMEVMEGLVSHLKVYDTYNKEEENILVRMGRDYDGGYIVPKITLEKAEALIGYGIRNDISFEEAFSNIYNKESYGFDCGTKSIAIKNSLTRFIDECIGSTEFLENANLTIDASKITSFNEHLNTLDLIGKKLFIKMDIEGGEFKSFPEVLSYSKDITGIALEIHFWRSPDEFLEAIALLESLKEHFILVHVHASNCRNSGFTTKNSVGLISRTLELSYINKNLVQRFELSKNQTHPSEMDMPICPSKEDPSFTVLTK